MRTLIIDLGLPANVLKMYVERREANNVVKSSIEELIRVAESLKDINVFIGVSVLDPYRDIYDLEEVEKELGLRILPIIQITAGVHTFSDLSHQIDTEGDDIGSLCPTRGRDEFGYLAESFLNKFKAFSIDITDMFAFSPEKGLTSCLCPSCINAINSILRNEGVDPDEVINAVYRGVLRYAVESRDENGYSTYPLRLMKYEESKYVFEGLPKDLLRALELSYLFIKARSILVTKLISDAFSGKNGYKAVFLESGKNEGIISVFSDTTMEREEVPDIDFYVGSAAIIRFVQLGKQNVGVYNYPRGRYPVGKLSESLWRYASAAQYIHKKAKGTSEISKKLKRELKRAMDLYNNLVMARIYVPRLEYLVRQAINYAVFGLEPAMKLVKYIIETIEDFTEYNPQEIDEIFQR